KPKFRVDAFVLNDELYILLALADLLRGAFPMADEARLAVGAPKRLLHGRLFFVPRAPFVLIAELFEICEDLGTGQVDRDLTFYSKFGGCAEDRDGRGGNYEENDGDECDQNILDH